MKLSDLIALALYAAGVGFCASVGRTAYRVDAHSVVVALTVQSTLEDEDAAPLLAAWSRGEVTVTLVPPKPAEQQKDLAA